MAFYFARAKAGNSIPARIAIMAITTKSSIKVKPRRAEPFGFSKFIGVFGLIDIRAKVLSPICVQNGRAGKWVFAGTGRENARFQSLPAPSPELGATRPFTKRLYGRMGEASG